MMMTIEKYTILEKHLLHISILYAFLFVLYVPICSMADRSQLQPIVGQQISQSSHSSPLPVKIFAMLFML